jgi:hypothetical protein
MQYLHPEVWSQVSNYLSAEDLGILCSSNRSICRHILNGTTRLFYTGPVTRLFQAFPNLNTLICLHLRHGVNVLLLPNTLTVLSLPQDKMLTDGDLCNLPPYLTSLNLQDNSNITDDGVSHPRSLTYLNLRSNEQITDAGLRYLPRDLTYLNLSYNRNVTDAGVAYFPRSLTYLSYNSNITDAGVAYFPRYVTVLDLWYNRNITDLGVPHFPRSNMLRNIFELML